MDGWDVDLPTFLEANWITNTVAKVLWVSVYLLVYGARPMIIRPKSFGAPPLVVECACRAISLACGASAGAVLASSERAAWFCTVCMTYTTHPSWLLLLGAC